MVPDMNSLNVSTDTSIDGAPSIFADAKWRSAVGDGELVNQNGISVIKNLYYADEGLEDPVDTGFGNYIKLNFNTSDPAIVGYSGGDGVITTYSSGFVHIAYDTTSQEVEKLQELFGTPVLSDSNYASNVYNEEMSYLCKEIYLSQATERKIFLKENQPNSLGIRDLIIISNYVEYNPNVRSLIETPSAMSMTTTTPGGY